ncbi:Glyoxalase/bleomycin resistance protein/dioxygenase [Lasiosphaeris hirsuta]|uniref:Glyoxalase/bleomycin resistance protein/dioxygenase n=1 Tax=Lasiosphaeris hirsuta TaxID=260670 RepID=A0AA40AY56_9PEZI|nr:Glyoxalase/bleomycin resistance protein/dioxygenase [Lasiosphaeris hirsuta]
MTIAHTAIKVTADKYEATLAFYEAALAPLGYCKVLTYLDGKVSGFGPKEDPHAADWWVSVAPEESSPVPTHHAFVAPDESFVDAFYKAAVGAGAEDNGAPGVRPNYDGVYYAAYVLDPAGNNIEAAIRRK